MVKAELSHNPYLLETEVLFNGNPPRINSLIEKYQDEKLQVWIDEIPQYFYNEMNGYNFDLVFSGTELDFEELKQAFLEAGVGEDRVRLIHGTKLGSRHVKALEMEEFFEWLAETPNRRFDWPLFRDSHKELIEGVCSFVAIGGQVSDSRLFDDIDISIDRVDSANELRKTDLHSIPVLFLLDQSSIGSLQFNLQELLKRHDVDQGQLFFLIDSELGDKVERVIKDLGVNDPQIISEVNAPEVHRYLEVFPVSERLHDAIETLNYQAESLKEILDEENRLNEIANKDTHDSIMSLDEKIGCLKATFDAFATHGELEMPAELLEAKAALINEINGWRRKKTKITGEEDARVLANEFESLMDRQFGAFRQIVIRIYLGKCSDTLARCVELYLGAHRDEGFVASGAVVPSISDSALPRFASDLMGMGIEQRAAPKEDFFEGFGRLFSKTGDTASQEPAMETVFYCEQWRSHVEFIVIPLAESMIQEARSSLLTYYEQLCGIYKNHLVALIKELLAEREGLLAQLSEDEKLLQVDTDWHSAFCEKLRIIERS